MSFPIPSYMNNGFIEDEEAPKPKQTYTVKYIGVVEGSMGILSRKMRMPKYTEAAIYEKRNSYDASNQLEDRYLYIDQEVGEGRLNETFDLEGHGYNDKSKKPNLNFENLSANRNIIIDKPLFSNKRESKEVTYNDTGMNVTHHELMQEREESTKSPINQNREVTETDEATRTPDIELRPSHPDVIRERNENSEGVVSPRISAEVHL